MCSALSAIVMHTFTTNSSNQVIWKMLYWGWFIVLHVLFLLFLNNLHEYQNPLPRVKGRSPCLFFGGGARKKNMFISWKTYKNTWVTFDDLKIILSEAGYAPLILRAHPLYRHFSGSRRWSLSQLSSGGGRLNPGASHQFIAGLRRKSKNPSHSHNLESSIHGRTHTDI